MSELSAKRIANCKGVPGTLGALAWTRGDRQPVLLSTWHVLFGQGAGEQGTVWLVEENGGGRRFHAAGRTLYGRIGAVRMDGDEVYVDCAVSSCAVPFDGMPRFSGTAAAEPGSRVWKTGGATGTTEGVVIDASYPDLACLGEWTCPAPRQLLVAPGGGAAAFSAEGDSGAVLVNERNEAVGLLWGTNARGEGVACPIEPVLRALSIDLEIQRG